MIHILNLDNFDKKIRNWVHENPNDIQQICRRAMIIGISPLVILGLVALIIIAIIEICES